MKTICKYPKRDQIPIYRSDGAINWNLNEKWGCKKRSIKNSRLCRVLPANFYRRRDNNDINNYIFEEEDVDLTHTYIDGTKVEANANKYTWVWKKSYIKSRNNVYAKLNGFVADLNEDMVILERAVFETWQEYSVEYVDYILKTYLNAVGMTKEDFVHGSGKRKTVQQKWNIAFLKMILAFSKLLYYYNN